MKHTLLKNRELLARTVKSVHLYTSFDSAAMWMSSHEHTSPLFSSASLCSPTKERLAAMRGTAPGRHTDLKCAPLRHKAPGSLSQGSNRQEFSSPGSQSRRVVPWGDVSSWVKGAE